MEENVNGLIIIRCGNPPLMSKLIGNCISYEKDQFIKGDITKKRLHVFQKPIKFFEELIELFRRVDIRWLWWNR